MTADAPCPVLVVHGIWDSKLRMRPLLEGLRLRGLPSAFTLRPNDGSAPIESLARQVRDQAQRLCAEHGVPHLDLVGFSMGALTARYYLQRLGGVDRTRRFVSISGPQQGTHMARLSRLAGVRQMRPGSALIRDLQSDPEPWGHVQVHCIYTPFDLMIVPARSSVLPGARSIHSVTVPWHRRMIADRRVLDLTASLLGGISASYS